MDNLLHEIAMVIRIAAKVMLVYCTQLLLWLLHSVGVFYDSNLQSVC